jgi:REP element-mobilizing transposase RayT
MFRIWRYPMTVPRSELVDLSVTPFYHCISRCVRRAFLCGEGKSHRKDWLEKRLEKLSNLFAISVCSYSAMDNHLHVVIRIEGREQVEEWSDREVVARWGKIYPSKDKAGNPLPATKEWINEMLKDADWVTKIRKRLANLSWFMKCLKEPLARMANKEDEVTGHFWEGRFKSIAIIDNEALLAACAYVDLNPVTAGMVPHPEDSDHTSLKTRIQYCRDRGQQYNLEQALNHLARGAKIDPQDACQLEQQLWLCPFADLPTQAGNTSSSRLGMLRGFSLPQYLQLVEWTRRQRQMGTANVNAHVSALLERLGTNADTWSTNLQRLYEKQHRWLGVAFSFSRDKLREAAAKRGCHHLANLCGCKA